ncbi:hypothetical protein NC653_014193 [Populus alba x Populus x berolinensis]|uniref:Uncharacterized protein n=1 Tax=Populus alba x Populus x berolinensis TaxID=444605 RepID=A0AAD6QWF8_9ROSI|nr:hypothetical protein NC653_014193 [Populus alba x Populus x berolinensis]
MYYGDNSIHYKRERKSPSRDPVVTFCQRYKLKEDNPTFKSSCCINSSFH